MAKIKHNRLYIVAAFLILGFAAAFVYHLQSSRRALLYRLPRRSQPLAPQGVAEQQMLQGKFGQDIPPEQRQIVSAELQASERISANQSVETPAQLRPGEQHIAITQPLGTTVGDPQPTFTWDANVDGWRYRVHVEEQNAHETVITSPILDEAMWQIPTPLRRGHTYVWSVDAIPVGIQTTATTVTSAPARFAILSDEGEQAIQNAKAHNASHLLLGSLYTHYEMWRDAVMEYRKMVDEVPDSPEAMKLLRNAEIRASSKPPADSAP